MFSGSLCQYTEISTAFFIMICVNVCVCMSVCTKKQTCPKQELSVEYYKPVQKNCERIIAS